MRGPFFISLLGYFRFLCPDLSLAVSDGEVELHSIVPLEEKPFLYPNKICFERNYAQCAHKHKKDKFRGNYNLVPLYNVKQKTELLYQFCRFYMFCYLQNFELCVERKVNYGLFLCLGPRNQLLGTSLIPTGLQNGPTTPTHSLVHSHCFLVLPF